MSAMWGVQNDHPELGLIEKGFISIGWDDVGDLKALGVDKEALKQKLATSRPEAKPGATPVWAGVLLRFADEMQPGDIVIYRYKSDSTLNFGRKPEDKEAEMLGAFIDGASDEPLARLRDPQHPFPFANLEWRPREAATVSSSRPQTARAGAARPVRRQAVRHHRATRRGRCASRSSPRRRRRASPRPRSVRGARGAGAC
jgi:hypothetical protein